MQHRLIALESSGTTGKAIRQMIAKKGLHLNDCFLHLVDHDVHEESTRAKAPTN